MKFRVTFKTPDALEDAAEEAAIQEINRRDDLLDDDIPDETDEFQSKLTEFAEKWVAYGEYVTIEFDLDKKIATVLEK